MKIITAVLIVAALLPTLVGCNKEPAKHADDDKPEAAQSQVTLSSEDVEHLGILTAAVQAATYTPSVRGFGNVVSFDALAQSTSDVTTAAAAARQSQAALAHAHVLLEEKLITRDALASAERQAATDSAGVLLAQRKQAVSFGRNAPWQSSSENGALISALAKGKLVLVRASFPSSAPSQHLPNALTIERVQKNAAGTSWSSNRIWQAPADPNLPGWGMFALLSNSDLAEGERVIVSMPVGQPISGFLVPSNAALLSGDNAWFYTQTKPGVYVRHALDIARPTQGGYFITDQIKRGDQVVTQGQALLLAHELNPSSGDKD